MGVMRRNVYAALFLAACGCDWLPRGGAGESCTKNGDCLGGMKCIQSKCVADGRSEGSTKPESTDEPEPEGTRLPEVKAGRGPFESVRAYCPDDAEACAVLSQFATPTIAGLGTVKAVDVGSADFSEVVIAIEASDGLYVTKPVIELGGGTALYTELKGVTIEPEARSGVAKVDIKVEVDERIDDGTDKPGAEMPSELTSTTISMLCAHDSNGKPGCTQPRHTSKALPQAE